MMSLHPSDPPSSARIDPCIQVAAGVIRDGAGRVLIAKRPVHVHQGDLWEFPGGKLEHGETTFTALRRELREELDIEALDSEPLLCIRHAYPDQDLVLHVQEVARFAGRPRGMQGQPIRWVEPDKLPDYAFPAANRPIIAAARLPSCYAILEDDAGNPEELRRRLGMLVERGVRMIQLRARRLPSPQYGAFAEFATAFCRARGVSLLLNAAPELVLQTGADGLHLRAEHLRGLRRRPLDDNHWVGASCHDPEELRMAERIGADFAVLGPVCPTLTHPGVVALGWEHFADWVEDISIPVFALGGLSPAQAGLARLHGGQGVAGIRGFLEE